MSVDHLAQDSSHPFPISHQGHQNATTCYALCNKHRTCCQCFLYSDNISVILSNEIDLSIHRMYTQHPSELFQPIHSRASLWEFLSVFMDIGDIPIYGIHHQLVTMHLSARIVAQ
jgi:hypothetical protein